ncbi:hypothetical protein D1164_19000 [Mariniphaga sediminis]|uniref:Sulfatase N-terminal domain-containing protein n=1 Tax=Mariniphaga sediminis TaxID=1628158 RepID=A0A399CZL1_9BACT|nr:sulfatase-like hydrolase/transferase [Mariniphaga sediminis]RIH63520.1 hypothetical protein D1164_19000 [Mariniphaga sediminis]
MVKTNLQLLKLSFLFFFLLTLRAGAEGGGEKPNIIFIICDQMRGDAFGAAGNEVVHTPHLDRLAKSGVMFTNNFSNNPVCLASRISMFSGKYATETGVLSNSYPEEKHLEFEKSLPWHFKEAGYRTGYIGKNHTYRKKELKNFDTLTLRGREEFRAYSKYVPPFWHSDTFWPEEDCNPGKNTRDAIDFIQDEGNGQPFFLVVSYFDPHPPYMAPSEYSSKYCASEMELPGYIDPGQLGSRLSNQQKALHYDKISETDLKETMRYYYASIEWGVDHQVGQLVEALQKEGMDENTIIVFTSDHGDFMGQHKMVRKGMFLYDALLHVPMIWYAPGIIREGLAIDEVSQNVDIFPTLLDFAGLQIPEYLAGQSLKNQLLGNKPARATQHKVFAHATYSDLPEGYWNDPEPYFDPQSDVPFHTRVQQLTWENESTTRMVRTTDWKLILSDTHKPELYFMDGGNVEKENVYGKPGYNEKFLELKKMLEEK